MNPSTRRPAPEPSGFAFRPALAGGLLLAVVLAGPAAAQIIRGAISGTVRDASGSNVPGATVTVTNMDTNISRTTVSDANGFYRVAALDPGRYAVRTTLAGFSTVENKDISVRTASEVTLNVGLTVAPVGEEITVTGKAEGVELNKTNPTIGLTATARQAVELPLGGSARNINNLVVLSANALNLTAGTSGAGNVAQGGTPSTASGPATTTT